MNILICILILISLLNCLNAQIYNKIPSVSAQEVIELLNNDPHIKKIITIKDPYFRSLITLVDKVKALENNDSSFLKTYKHFFHNTFFGPAIEAAFPKGIILLTQKQAPQLHTVIEELCTQLALEKPLIFLTCSKKVYNACASSLSSHASVIVIGQKLLRELTEQELKAVLAHELSHIKKSHVSKKLLYTLASATATAGFIYWIARDTDKTNNQIQTPVKQKPQQKKTLLSCLNYPSVKLGLFGLFCVAYHLFMMRISQQHETEADMLALQTTGNPEAFSNMIETFKKEISEKLRELEEDYTYVTEHLKIIKQTSPNRFASISSDAQHHYKSTKDGLQNLIDGNGSTHPSLDARQKIAQQILLTSTEEI